MRFPELHRLAPIPARGSQTSGMLLVGEGCGGCITADD